MVPILPRDGGIVKGRLRGVTPASLTPRAGAC
jgi:hypothetical protein